MCPELHQCKYTSGALLTHCRYSNSSENATEVHTNTHTPSFMQRLKFLCSCMLDVRDSYRICTLLGTRQTYSRGLNDELCQRVSVESENIQQAPGRYNTFSTLPASVLTTSPFPEGLFNNLLRTGGGQSFGKKHDRREGSKTGSFERCRFSLVQ